ncbi:PqqD family peptide modification chaperone [Fusobacterium sp. SYSU M8A802]
MIERIALWDITSQCNLKCKHCYNEERYWGKNKYNELSKEDIDKVLSSLIKMNATALHLLGGEPILCSNIEYILKKAKENNLQVTMVSNGTLIDEKIFKKLCQLELTALSISMDGTDQESHDYIRGNGSFNKTIENLKTMVKYKKENNVNIIIGIALTLTKKSINSAKNLIKFGEELGIDGVTLAYVTNEGKAKEDYSNLGVTEEEKFSVIDRVISDYKNNTTGLSLYIDARQLLGEYIFKKYGIKIQATNSGCKGGNSRFYIIADGTILPCSPAGTTMGKFIKEKYLKGFNPPNVLENNFLEIIESNYFINFYNFAHNIENYNILNPCKECNYNCYPCPLLYNINNPNVKECLYAKKKIIEIESLMLKTSFSKKDNLRINTLKDKIEIIDFYNQDKYILEDIGFDIWNLIDGIKTVEDIINIIKKDYNSDNDIHLNKVIYRDILDFIFDLREKNFLFNKNE